FDTLDDGHLLKIGRLLWAHAQKAECRRPELGEAQEPAEGRVPSGGTQAGQGLPTAGRLLPTAQGRSLFVVGSHSVEVALAAWWRAQGLVQNPSPLVAPGPVEQIVVMSGSASPATAEQIDWAEAHGFHSIRLDVPRLVSPETAEQECHKFVQEALAALE